MDSYADAFGTSREIIEVSLNCLPGVEVLETKGKFATVKTDMGCYTEHVILFVSLRAEVQSRMTKGVKA